MDPERQEKLSHLKKAIQTGTYNEEQWLNELLHNMSAGLEDSSESEPDTPPD